MFYLSLSNIKQQGPTTYPGSLKITAQNFHTSLSAKKGPKQTEQAAQPIGQYYQKNFNKTNCNYNALSIYSI